AMRFAASLTDVPGVARRTSRRMIFPTGVSYMVPVLRRTKLRRETGPGLMRVKAGHRGRAMRRPRQANASRSRRGRGSSSHRPVDAPCARARRREEQEHEAVDHRELAAVELRHEKISLRARVPDEVRDR